MSKNSLTGPKPALFPPFSGFFRSRSAAMLPQKVKKGRKNCSILAPAGKFRHALNFHLQIFMLETIVSKKHQWPDNHFRLNGLIGDKQFIPQQNNPAMMSNLFSATISLTFLLVLFVNHLMAQPDAHSTTNSNYEYCDKLLPGVSEKLQNDANQACESLSTCIACLERQTGQPVYMTLVAHPTDPKCKPLTTLPDAISRGGRTDAPNSFLVEILQSPCGKSGNNLTAFIPGLGNDSAEFSFQWSIDGKDAGTTSKVSCVCGKTATLKVHRKSTAEDASVSVKLNPCN